MKRFLFLTILFFALPSIAHGATEFVSIVDTGGSSSSDFSSISSWEGIMTGSALNIGTTATQVFSGTTTGSINNNVTVYQCRTGTYQSKSGTMVYDTKAGQALVKSITAGYSFSAGDRWYTNNTCSSASYFTISNTGDTAIVVAKLRTTDGSADTTAVTIDGWTTSSSNYIKIYTDPSENYRHKGVWDESRYRVVAAAGWSGPIIINEQYVRVDGLQVENTGVKEYVPSGFSLNAAASTSSRIEVSNNIVRATGSGTYDGSNAVGIALNDRLTVYVWNNIVYDFYIGYSGQYSVAANTSVLYSNTFINNESVGVNPDTGTTNHTIRMYNNLVQGSTTDYGYCDDIDAHGNNISSDATSPDGASYQNKTAVFADQYNKDYHLDSSDTIAKNAGANLYADASLAVTTDIDNNVRPNSTSFDIGADENVAAIYRSVGAGATAALASGGNGSNYGYMEIKPAYLNVGSTANLTDYVATFWRPLPDNIGVGDALSYDADNTGGIDNTVFITKRIDSTHYSVRTSTGAAPVSTSSQYNTGWNIRRAYTSLFYAEAGTENVGIGRTFDAGNLNLTTNNLQWNFAMYANGTAADTTAVTIDGWTTSADNYMRIYTPTRTDEVGISQRHQGKWDDNKYRIITTPGGNYAAIYVKDDYVAIDGLQVKVQGAGEYTHGITNDGTNYATVRNNIVVGDGSGSSEYYGIQLYLGTNGKIYNNIVYNFGTGMGIVIDNCESSYIYNNTIFNSGRGYQDNGGTILPVLKNNIAQTSSYGYYGSFSASSTNNLSTFDDAPGSNPQNFKDVTFINETAGSEDLHLAPSDTVAKNIGVDLSNDLSLPIKTDIDSSDSIDGINCPADSTDACYMRPTGTSFDIGADELITKIYRSVGVGTTAAILTGSNPSLSLTISGFTGTFSTFPTSAAFGVGDVIRYDSDNNGTVDSTAFVTAIDSTAKTVSLQAADGSQPTQMAVGDIDWKLYRAYTSVSDWESGTENTGVGVTYDAGNLDITTRSEQWNVSFYSPAGTDTTAADTTSVTINGWTTAKQNYIRLFSPYLSSEVTTSQRHQGKWDSTKYHLDSAAGTYKIYIQDDFVRVEGLQINLHASSDGAIVTENTAAGSDIRISSNILAAPSGQTNPIGIYVVTATIKIEIWNNIIYGMKDTVNNNGYGIQIPDSLSTEALIFNNTIVDTDYSIFKGNDARVVVKNNITQGSTIGFYGASMCRDSDYNISNLANDAPGAHSQNSTTVSFLSTTSGSEDFHLSLTDTAARNSGRDLSKDVNFPMTADINAHTRYQIRDTSYQWDIGADEAATPIYRSIAPSATTAIASGTSPANSLIIAGTSATFGTAPGDTIGVGDAIQYDSDDNGTVDSAVFITYRTSSTSYTIQTHDGGTPTSTIATDYDWSIFRAYTTLDNAEGGVENSGLADAVEHFDQDVGIGDGKDLYTPNQQWNIAAYANGTTADSTAVTIGDWTTYPTNYIRIYTPTATTEVGTSQRHQGKWDTSKYVINPSSTYTVLYIREAYVRADGLQIDNGYTAEASNGININMETTETSSDVRISNSIFTKASQSSSSYREVGIEFNSDANITNGKIKIWNNIFYDFSNGNSATSGIYPGESDETAYIYNNTFQNCSKGIYKVFGTVIVKNNITQNCTDGYSGTFDSSSDYNISDVTGDTTDISASYNPGTALTASFADSVDYDFHLANNDTVAKNAGADLSGDANLAFSTDIDGQTRMAGKWDIGADENNNVTIEIKRNVNFGRGAIFK